MPYVQVPRIEWRQRFQKAVFPEGLGFTSEKGFGTATSSSFSNALWRREGGKSPMAPPRGIEPLFPG
jgi:hypothetical protein